MKEALLRRDYISASDFHFIESVRSAEEAVDCILRFYRRFHSQRYVDNKLVIRLTSSVSHDTVEELNELYADILTPGGSICTSGPLPAEAEEPELAGLPRLIVDFNRRDFGRLRTLIDCVNNA
jgi:hypothetical protein